VNQQVCIVYLLDHLYLSRLLFLHPETQRILYICVSESRFISRNLTAIEVPSVEQQPLKCCSCIWKRILHRYSSTPSSLPRRLVELS